MYAAQWARLKGASRIIGIDTIPERLAFAMNRLQIETINFQEYKDVPKRILELVPGGVDVALDCGRQFISVILVTVLKCGQERSTSLRPGRTRFKKH